MVVEPEVCEKSKKQFLSFLSTDNSGEYVLEGSGVCLASDDKSGWRGLGGCCLFMASEGISLCLGEVLKNKF